MAMTYKEYTDLGLGSFYDREEEKRAIARNIQDPVQRAAILADFEGRPSYAQALPFSAGLTYEQGAQKFMQANAPSSFMQAASIAPQIPSIQNMLARDAAIEAQRAAQIRSQGVMRTRPTETTSPSALASQESGAIGAASIASQMGATPTAGSFAKAATSKPKPYTVQRGDTLSSIAKRNNMSLAQLMKLNPKFKQQAKYQGGRMIFGGTKVNLAPKPAPKKKAATPFSPAQFRMAEERSMQQPAPTLQNPLQPNQGGFR